MNFRTLLLTGLTVLTPLGAAQITTEEAQRILEEVEALEAPTTPPRTLPGGYLEIGWDRLATFSLNLPGYGSKLDAKAVQTMVDAQIPTAVKAFDGQKVFVTGYVLPMKVEKGLTTEFLLQQIPLSCCFAVTPVVNQWIHVRLPKGARTEQDVLFSFYGTLRVRTQVEKFGFVTSIYELEGERMAPATK